MLRTLLVIVALLSLVACGGATEGHDSPAPVASTSGGEAEPSDAPAEQSVEPAPSEPVVMRMTVPVPVPQPAVPREDLSSELEAVWTRVEEQVQLVRPPADGDSVEEVQAWADGPFRAWLERRREALVETHQQVAAVAPEPPYERAVALALLAYVFEDLGAQIGGSPVPADIAADESLRNIYIESLNEATLPLGRSAIEFYAECQQRLESLGDTSAWLPWRAYCVQRGQEVIDGYGLTPEVGAERTDTAEEPPEAESNPSDM